jgi:four helix bundle protein
VQDYRKLKVWEKAHALCLAVYRLVAGNVGAQPAAPNGDTIDHETASFPKHQLYGLASQMQRSSSSIPTNIVEGCGLGTTKELAKFLHYSLASAKELEYQLLLSKDLGYITVPTFEQLTNDVGEVQRMPLRTDQDAPEPSMSLGTHPLPTANY